MVRGTRPLACVFLDRCRTHVLRLSTARRIFISTVCTFLLVSFVFVDSVTEMLLCFACVALGLAVSTSGTMTTNPFSGMLDQPTLVLLSAALGRFVFSSVHLLDQFYRPANHLTSWAVFRAVCVIVNVVCLSVVILSRQNLVLGAMILLLELGTAVEEASNAVERLAIAKTLQYRLERALTLIETVLVAVHIVFPTVLIVITIFALQRPYELGPPEVGLLCFAVAFYTLTALVPLRHQFDRRPHRQPVVSRLAKVRADGASTWCHLQVGGRPPVGAMSVDGKRGRVIKRCGVQLLHAVRGKRVCSVDVCNAIRIVAASARGLPGSNVIGRHPQKVTSSTS